MDPDKTLAWLRDATKRFDAATAGDRDAEALDAACDVVEMATSLDYWMSCGGFLPKEWQAHR